MRNRRRWTTLVVFSSGLLLAWSCSMVWNILQLIGAALTFVSPTA
jgi:hypothetical protein